jgi:hypothetical protein
MALMMKSKTSEVAKKPPGISIMGAFLFMLRIRKILVNNNPSLQYNVSFLLMGLAYLYQFLE